MVCVVCSAAAECVMFGLSSLVPFVWLCVCVICVMCVVYCVSFSVCCLLSGVFAFLIGGVAC